MAEMQALRALVAERLTAAAEEILSAVERMTTERKMLRTPETSRDQQRAAVRERLSAFADEIFRILEMMMSEYETQTSGSHKQNGRQRRLLDITLKTEKSAHRTDRSEKDVSCVQQKREEMRSSSQVQETSNLRQIKDASMETDHCELTHGKATHLHQTQRAGKDIAAVVDTEARAEGSDQKPPSSNNSQSVSEGNDSDEELHEKSLKSNQRTKFQSQGADCGKKCGTCFRKRKEMKKHARKITSTDKTGAAGRSCCRVCGKVFRYKRSFLKHVLQHEQSSDLCGACGKHLDSDESLKVHLQTHSEENICRDQTDSDSKVGEGDEDWRDGEGSDCEDGDDDKVETCLQNPSKTKKQASNTPQMPKNKDLTHLKYRCKVCGKSFCYRASFLKHVQEDERDADLCGVCGKHFESEESLRLHLQTYIRTNDCEVCGKHFEGHKQLEMHMRTHTGEKPYVCAVCGKAFAQNGNLMGHMRVHTGEKPYVCSVCGQSFSFKEYMMAHMRIHTGEKPFLCSVCGKGFRQRGTLKTHMMIHTGESTHPCSICDKKFYKSGALKIHMRSHTGEKPYLCNVCGKSFTAGGSLTKHMGVHEGERMHGCNVCSKGFVRKEDLKRHAQTHTDESTRLTSL